MDKDEMRECTEEEKKEFLDMWPPPTKSNPDPFKRNGIHDAIRVLVLAGLGFLTYFFPIPVLIGYLVLCYSFMGFLLLSGNLIGSSWWYSLIMWLLSPIVLPLILVIGSFLFL